jgi:hypothetical protein
MEAYSIALEFNIDDNLRVYETHEDDYFEGKAQAYDLVCAYFQFGLVTTCYLLSLGGSSMLLFEVVVAANWC